MKKIILLTYLMAGVYYFSFSQNVGVGTTTPLEKLHVMGNIKADTIKPNAIKLTPNAGTGKILTSDSAGNGSWQNISPGSINGNIGYGVWGGCDANTNVSEYAPLVDPTPDFTDNFGYSVAVSGNYCITGAPNDDIGANNNQGSASIFQFDGTSWVFMQKLTDATGASNDQFGLSVSISGNNVIVGAWQDAVGANTNQGSVSIYQFNGASWVLMQKITDASGATDDLFGFSVSISGNRAIVGAVFDQVGANAIQGSASIYQFNGAAWVLMQKITDVAGAAFDRLGYSVSISGNYVIIGAPGCDFFSIYTDIGAALIFQYNGSSWVLMQKIINSSYGFSGDWFGVSVSINGNYAIVGAYQFGRAQDNNEDQGAASIYQYNGSSWVLMQQLSNSDGKPFDKFGISVSISGDYAIVGIYNHDAGTNISQADVGAAVIYRRIGPAWQRIQYLTDPGANTNDWFGFAVAVEGNSKRFACGAIQYGNGSGKVIMGKINY